MRTLHRALWRPWGRGLFLMSEVLLKCACLALQDHRHRPTVGSHKETHVSIEQSLLKSQCQLSL